MDDVIKEMFPFKEFRLGQFDIIKHILWSFIEGKKKYFILEAPTGTGKSVISYTVGKSLIKLDKDTEVFSKPNIIIATSSKQLQMQYYTTFKSHKTEYLWSARNYKCALVNKKDDEVYYGSGGCLKQICLKINACEYLIQKKKFERADIGICNYHYLINAKSIEPKILILDEAHNLENILCENAALKFSKRGYEYLFNTINKSTGSFQIDQKEFIEDLQILLKLKFEELENGHLKKYCETFLDKINPYYIKLDAELKTYTDLIKDLYDQQNFTEAEHIQKIISKIGKSVDAIDSIRDKINNYLKSEENWVVANKDMGIYPNITIKPLKVNKEMEILSKRCKFMFLLSATICGYNQFIKELGINSDKSNYLETKCPFPIDNRRIYFKNAGSLNYKNKDEVFPLLIKETDYIINHITQNWKAPLCGIIHTVSYDNAEKLKELSEHRKKIFIPKGEDILTLNNFIKTYSEKGCIIASPSILEGVDLTDDLSRFQIFLKVPYGYLKDRWINTKKNLDASWYARDAIIKMVQGSGRSIRSIEDWAWTFIIDGNFNNLITYNSNMFPTWYKEAIFKL